jgi:hypothetical protein
MMSMNKPQPSRQCAHIVQLENRGLCLLATLVMCVVDVVINLLHCVSSMCSIVLISLIKIPPIFTILSVVIVIVITPSAINGLLIGQFKKC